MKQAIYNYLREELYPCPSCNHCQYSDPSMKRVPCERCEHEGDKYKLHKGHEADLRRMAREIVRIVKQKKVMRIGLIDVDGHNFPQPRIDEDICLPQGAG